MTSRLSKAVSRIAKAENGIALDANNKTKRNLLMERWFPPKDRTFYRTSTIVPLWKTIFPAYDTPCTIHT